MPHKLVVLEEAQTTSLPVTYIDLLVISPIKELVVFRVTQTSQFFELKRRYSEICGKPEYKMTLVFRNRVISPAVTPYLLSMKNRDVLQIRFLD
ncbi:unnamed protein product [Auanema sp. JU1783]|nr:unnamed protein product [Auanema sp. JU1783]